MAAVKPAQPVPRITVSRTELSLLIALIRLAVSRFDATGLLGLLFRRGRRPSVLRGVVAAEPGNIGAERAAQSQHLAVLGHDVGSLAEQRLVRALVRAFTPRQHDRAFRQPLHADAANRCVYRQQGLWCSSPRGRTVLERKFVKALGIAGAQHQRLNRAGGVGAHRILYGQKSRLAGKIPAQADKARRRSVLERGLSAGDLEVLAKRRFA